MMSLPPTPSMTSTTLTLPWTRIGWRGGGRAVAHLICCCHGLCHWHHLCLHSRDDGAQDKGCGNIQGCCADNSGQEEVGHHKLIGTEQKKKNRKKINNSDAMSPPLRLQTATPVLPPLMPLHKQRQQRQQHRSSGGSSSSRAVAAAAHYFELPCSFTAIGIKFPFLIHRYLSEKMILGTKTVTELPQLHTY
jgi:hypothetical protein